MANTPFQDDTLLARWLSGELSPTEEASLRERADFADFERLVGNLERMQPPEFKTDDEFTRLMATRRAQTEQALPSLKDASLHPRPRLLKRLRPWIATAATIALLISAWMFWPDGTPPYLVANGEPNLLAELSEGSTARLNAGSDLDFVVSPTERLASLNGEAYFDVKKSAVPFIVETPRGRVTVVGTSFNVFSRGDSMAVSCTSGQVRVRFEGVAEAYPLTPGNEVAINAAGTVTAREDASQESLDWLSDRSVFVNRPLGEVLEELERQFDLKIRLLGNLDPAKKYNIAFPNDDVEAALSNVVTTIKDYTFERSDRIVTLRPTN